MDNARILVIEDDPDIALVLKLQLEEAKHDITVHHSFASAENDLIQNQYDLFLIDRMLPGLSGLEICKFLRKNNNLTPIIFITAMSTPENIIEGLDAGANDYIIKPFDINILYARVRAQLRMHTTLQSSPSSEIIEFKNISIDSQKHILKVDNEPLHVTHTEFRILYTLMTKPGIVFSRESLIKEIIGSDVHVTNRTIDTHVAGLRKKLSSNSDIIETIRGVGYRLKDE